MKRVTTLVSTWTAALGLSEATDIHPAAAERLAERDGGLERRETVMEAALGVATLGAATALAVLAPAHRPLDVGVAVALTAGFAIAKRVRFHDGGGYTTPTQLMLVPLLLLLPAAVVPLLVIAGSLLSDVERSVRGQVRTERLLLHAGDSLYALGPALVIALAGPAEPAWSAWPIYLAALAAQFAFDLAVSVFRDWFVVGLGADLGLPLLAWTWLVDAGLATIGLLAALAARGAPYCALLVLPLVALLTVFSRERSARIEHSLELSRAYRGTTLLLSDVLDGDDEYTAFHSRGVVRLSIAVADRMQLDARQRRNVEFGALLHDVGKIAIPKEILNKPGKLSPDEWVVMETHTVEGQRMLDRVGGVLGDVGQIVRCSHERWDGSGYPDGLAGEAIPLESTIVSACDAFNAMTTHRPYRRALSLAEALDELRANSGTQFAPRVVDALIELIVEEEAIVGPAAPEPRRTQELDMPTLTVPDVRADVRAG